MILRELYNPNALAKISRFWMFISTVLLHTPKKIAIFDDPRFPRGVYDVPVRFEVQNSFRSSLRLQKCCSCRD